MRRWFAVLFVATVLAVAVSTPGESTDSRRVAFAHFESPHVHPLDLSPSGELLAAVNTSANTVILFDVTGRRPVEIAAIAVGLDPISARFRSDEELWVVNHVSDSISLVDVPTRRVRATLLTGDEPADVVFAGAPSRAFVSISQSNQVQVFRPDRLDEKPRVVAIEGEDPRALTVSADGKTVYVAVFESGNRTTVVSGGFSLRDIPSLPTLPQNAVSDAVGPYGGTNPPPNAGSAYEPPLAPDLPEPPPVSHIVRKDDAGRWMDDNGGDWTEFVSGSQAHRTHRVAGWDVIDNDLATIDVDSLDVGYIEGLLNIVMALTINPGTGEVVAVGTDATNEVRFEPNLQGRFLRVQMASATSAGATDVVDLNPHLDYRKPRIPRARRAQSLGDPRAIVWDPATDLAWIAGMGSNNVVRTEATGKRVGDPIVVAEGPTGLALDPDRERVYVLSRFGAVVTVLDSASGRALSDTEFFDPTPEAIRAGRQHLFDTHANSGTGHLACASCHVDARMDRLAWDLGNPAGEMKSDDDQNKTLVDFDFFEDWHPMKGPMTTQTLVDIIGKEPHHWRGDRDGIEEFAAAFADLQGADEPLSAGDMQELEDYLATLYFPPNPFREIDNSLPAKMDLEGHYRTDRFGRGGDPLPNGRPARGLRLFRERAQTFPDGLRCVDCHVLPTGYGPALARTGNQFVPIPPGPNGEQHIALIGEDAPEQRGWKIPQLRNLYDKVGMEATQRRSRAGFGFNQDGAIDSLARFVGNEGFGLRNDQEVADMVAFMLAFSGNGLSSQSDEPPGVVGNDVPAGVGQQVTISRARESRTRLRRLRLIADSGEVELIAHSLQDGRQRGWLYDPGTGIYLPDTLGEDRLSHTELTALARQGAEITFTLVPLGSGTRLGRDRDLDGILDGDDALLAGGARR